MSKCNYQLFWQQMNSAEYCIDQALHAGKQATSESAHRHSPRNNGCCSRTIANVLFVLLINFL